LKKLLILVVATIVMAAQIEIKNKDTIALEIKKGELILLNLPFKIKSDKDIELFGSKKHVDVRFKEKSIYFATAVLPLKMLVYGGETPLYLEFKEAKSKTNEKVFTLVDTSGVVEQSGASLHNIDKKIVDIVKTISPDGDFRENNYYKEDINETMSIDGVQIHHIARYKDPVLVVDKYFVHNPTFETKKLREISLFSREQKTIANAFGNYTGILEYDNFTWVYVFREPSLEVSK